MALKATHELVGRETEQALLERFLEGPHDSLRALFLEGEAGIGKTSLWRTALSSTGAAGYRLLRSAPAEAESALPYAGLGDLLDPLPEEAAASLATPLRLALDTALFRASADQAPTDQLAVSTAFLRIVRRLAFDQPVLLAVDDLQWVDRPSMRVLAFALHRLHADRVRLLAALRVPPAGDPGSTLRKALPDGRVERLSIKPLSLDAIDDLLLQRLARPLRRPELDQVYAISGGNPFFALEIGQFILEQPTRVTGVEPIPVPRSLTDAVNGRLTKLPAATRDILVAAAALTRPDEALLQRVDPAGAAALDPAVSANIVERSGGRLRFTHPLLASVIYATAETARRRRWHRRLADAVGDAEERARQLALSATGPDAAVAEAVEAAARLANARGAPDAAAGLAQQASELTPMELKETIERRSILSAEYRMRAGDVPGARHALDAVLRSSTTGRRPAEALRLMGSLTLGGDDLIGAERFLTEALSQTGDDLDARALIERDLITVFSQRGKVREAFDHSEQVSKIAVHSRDASLLALAHRLKAVTERQLFGHVSPEARATAAAIAEDRISVAMDDAAGGLHPLMHWGVLLKWSDDFDRARILFKRALALTEGRDESLRAPILFHLAEMECWAGDWLLAAVYAHECEKSVIHTGHRSYSRLPLTATAMLHCCHGELEAARAAAEEALSIATNVGDEPYLRRALAILGANALAAEDPGTADGHLKRLRARGNHQAYRGAVRSESDEVDTLIALGRLEEVESVYARLSPYADPWPRAISARGRALLAATRGDFETSFREFERALAVHDTLAMPLERARTLLAYGTALRRAKHKRAARQRVEEALQVFRSLGAAVWINRAQAELSRITPAPAGVSELTPTEARVVALVATGRTNKEVAAELFLSVKTVEANLSRIYGKLNVRSRSELIARQASHLKSGVIEGVQESKPQRLV